MLVAGPGQTITIAQDGLTSGLAVGYQVIKAATGAVAIGRTTTGVVERPLGSGNYVATFVAPAEADLYLVVLDWSGGVLTDVTSVVAQLQVTSMMPAVTGLGVVADHTRVYLGGETFDGILASPSGGSGVVGIAIGNVKARIFVTAPTTAAEVGLPVLVVAYLGKLAALELMSAARAFWNSRPETQSTGSDPTEITTYPSRLQMLDDVATSLLAKIREEWPLVLPLVNLPLLRSADDGPGIDEDDLARRVTRDPRQFPTQRSFPYSKFDPAVPAGVVAE